MTRRRDTSLLPFFGTMALFALAATLAALWRGPWLDEFWSWHLGDPAMSGAEVLTRWRADTHPPLANALYWLVRQTGVADIPAARVVLNLGAVLFMTAGLLTIRRRHPNSGPLYLLFGLLVLAVASTIPSFVEFRSYLWQIAAAAVALSYCHALFTGSAASTRMNVADAVGMLAVLILLLLHHVTALLMGTVIASVVVSLWWQGHRRAALRLAVPLMLGVLLTGLVAVVQARTLGPLLDVRWVQSDTRHALTLMGLTLGAAFARAAVPMLLSAWLARPFGRVRLTENAHFAIVLAAGLVGGGGLLLIANALQPIVVFRYLLTWEVVVAFWTALLITPVATRKPVILWIVAGWSLVVTAIGAAAAGRDEGWRSGIDLLAREQRRCPTTKLYAAPHWRFGAAADSQSAAFETPIVQEAFQALAAPRGLSLTVLDQRTPAVLSVGRACPTMLLIPRLYGVPDTSAEALLDGGRLRSSAPASVGYAMRTGDLIVLRLQAR